MKGIRKEKEKEGKKKKKGKLVQKHVTVFDKCVCVSGGDEKRDVLARQMLFKAKLSFI